MVPVSILIDLIEDAERQFGQVLGGWHAVEDDRFVIGNSPQKLDNRRIAGIDEKRVVPTIDKMLPRQGFYLRKIHDHAVGGIAGFIDDVARQRDFDGIAMPVQMAALTLMIGDSMACIELESAGNTHGETREKFGARLYH